ncbi:MAG TPA: four helix bundle protein [Gemmatimonadaceae bacterium]|nr:four helix bundle protein [Gemmatimonadaceae bacterium]
MQNPANLEVFTHARALAVAVYRASAHFPSNEKFGLTTQMRRAAISVGSNIAEGCGRSGDRELVNFLHIALGSATELEFQALVAGDLEFLAADAAAEMLEEIRRAKKMLSRLITALRSRIRTERPGKRQ